MTGVAVVAHRRKSVGGGLPELRRHLHTYGADAPLWYEVDQSADASARARDAVEDGADLVFAWGGDGTVQRCIDALAGTGADLAIVPAGTANLLATNLGVPLRIEEAVIAGLFGDARPIDVGTVNGERFAVMTGAGFDGSMIAHADRHTKERLGRLAYVWSGARAARRPVSGLTIDVEGHRWFEGDASCVLVANVGTVSGGLRAFPSADPGDGRLDVGVVTADGMLQWLRVFSRMASGHADRSPLVAVTAGERIDVRMEHKTRYELDGGSRSKTKRLKVGVEPAAIRIRVPEDGGRR